MAAEGATVARGEPLFKIDELPVVALYGAVPMYRTLSNGMGGADVKQLQENLVALGYAKLSAGFATDGAYTQATTAAILAWQTGLGLAQTGSVEPAQVVFTPGPVRIAEHIAQVGDLLANGGSGDAPAILRYTDATKIVIVALAVTDQALAVVGNAVTVTLPDERTVQGVIAKVGTTVQEDKFDVTVTIADQVALGALEAAPVDVDFVNARRENVLAVPVAALLALAEGGYGVEIIEGDSSRIVAVKTGIFADGQVEVSGAAIAEGMKVGVPQ
jgi:peptidoglycan hydrolase-like protein with peptidoglycan-binding domain